MRQLTILFFFTAFMTVISGCKKDPCETTVCQNDGYCANGDCVCPEGFTGADCSQQETPDKIRITKIEITRFQATDNGAGWDLSSGPDIYPELSKGSTNLYSASTFYQNADPSSNYSFDLNPAIDIVSPNDQYTIRLYDFDDFDADDFMGGINFTPYSSNNGFPNTINLDAGGDVSFTLYVDYVW